MKTVNFSYCKAILFNNSVLKGMWAVTQPCDQVCTSGIPTYFQTTADYCLTSEYFDFSNSKNNGVSLNWRSLL